MAASILAATQRSRHLERPPGKDPVPREPPLQRRAHPLIVEVAALPCAAREVERKVVVVVDALRASATLTALFDRGAESVLVAAGPAEALAAAGPDRAGYLVCGEVGGIRPPDFDHGNSPTEISSLDLAGLQVVLSTSNGTSALRSVAGARLVLVGTGRNGPAVAEFGLAACEQLGADLVVVCAGDDGGIHFSLEDFFFAGYLVELIADRRAFSWPVDEADPGQGDPTRWTLDESAVAARRLYRSYLGPGADPASPPLDDVRAALRDARNGHSLPRLGYGDDLDYCAHTACSASLPLLRVREGRLLLVGHD